MRWMMSLVVLLLLVSPAPAQLLMYEGFDYTTGAELNGLTNPMTSLNWNKPSVPAGDSSTALITEDSLSYPGLPDSTGNSFGLPRLTQSNVSRITLPGAPYTVTSPNKDLFFSFLLQMTEFDTSVSDLVAASTTHRQGDFIAGFTASSGGGMSGANVYASQLRIRRQLVEGVQNGKYELGLVKNNQTTNDDPPVVGLSFLEWDPQGFDVGETLLIVGEYQLNTSDKFDDVVRLWINPTPGELPGAPNLEITDGVDVSTQSGAAQSTVAAFWFRDGNVFLPGPSIVDELRVGLSYADVTPGASVGLAGDYNDDGSVDAADYVIWRKGGPLANETVSIDSVDELDYDEWFANYGSPGAGSGGGVSAAPEPASAGLLVLGIVGLLMRRRAGRATNRSPNH